jgi:hypothetical protein
MYNNVMFAVPAPEVLSTFLLNLILGYRGVIYPEDGNSRFLRDCNRHTHFHENITFNTRVVYGENLARNFRNLFLYN